MSRILIVEDSPTQARELQLILESDGFAVETVSNVEAALERLASETFDLVLTDILLPGVDGYELCRRVKTNTRTRNMPVVLLTVLRDPFDILRGLECGADNFLTKPYDPAFLLERILNILASRAGQPARPPEPGVTITYGTKKLTITSDKRQIVDLLLSAVEDSIRAREREHETRVAKEALERSERFIRSALDALTTRVAVLDKEGMVLAVNAAWRRSGISNQWLGSGCEVGMNYLLACEATMTQDGVVLARSIREVLKRERDNFSMEYVNPGSEDPAWFTVGVAQMKDAGPVRVVVTHEDVTDSKKLEATLRQRAQELVEEGLRRRNFQAMMAHELRNPLAPILSSLPVARHAGLATEARNQSLDTIERQARHLRRLVDDLLESARLESGKVTLRTERLDLARLIRNASKDNSYVVEAAGVQLNVETPDTPVWIMGDPTRLTQVITNLLDNAKFTDPGGSMLVRLEVEADGKSTILVVRDTGIGMDAETLDRLFQPLWQADRSLARSRGGLGLGLSVVKELIELHQGSINVTSEGPGHGAQFTICLPVEPEPVALSNPSMVIERSRRPLRVLVIEDNRDAAESLRVLLELLGHEPRIANNGPSGVQAAKDWLPDIVICDIGLPGLDGYGVSRALHMNPETARARFLALTGYGSDEDRSRSHEAGFDVHLTKPVAPEELQQYLCATGG